MTLARVHAQAPAKLTASTRDVYVVHMGKETPEQWVERLHSSIDDRSGPIAQWRVRAKAHGSPRWRHVATVPRARTAEEQAAAIDREVAHTAKDELVEVMAFRERDRVHEASFRGWPHGEIEEVSDEEDVEQSSTSMAAENGAVLAAGWRFASQAWATAQAKEARVITVLEGQLARAAAEVDHWRGVAFELARSTGRESADERAIAARAIDGDRLGTITQSIAQLGAMAYGAITGDHAAELRILVTSFVSSLSQAQIASIVGVLDQTQSTQLMHIAQLVQSAQSETDRSSDSERL